VKKKGVEEVSVWCTFEIVFVWKVPWREDSIWRGVWEANKDQTIVQKKTSQSNPISQLHFLWVCDSLWKPRWSKFPQTMTKKRACKRLFLWPSLSQTMENTPCLPYLLILSIYSLLSQLFHYLCNTQHFVTVKKSLGSEVIWFFEVLWYWYQSNQKQLSSLHLPQKVYS